MKIKDILYKSKGNYLVTILLAITCLIVILMTINNVDRYNMFTFCYPANYNYPWQYFSGVFVHGTPEFPVAASIGHLIFNLMVVIPFGLLIEKIIGDNRFSVVTLISWGIQALGFYIIAPIITPINETARGAGISLIAFMYGTIGAYILFKLLKKDKRTFFRQILTYIYLNILIAMIVMLNPFVAGISSLILHMAGILVGIAFIIYNYKYINTNIDKLFNGENLSFNNSKWNLLWTILPIFFIIIYIIV
jgi:membrane associated rhomboid family serine protease